MTQTATRTRLSAGERRRLILAAALRLFAERGYEGAAVGEIARAAGVTKAVLYDHFASKKDLHVELLAQETEAILAGVSAALDRASGSGKDRFRAAIDAFYRHAEERPFARLFLGPSPVGDREIAAAQADAQTQATRGIAAMFARAAGGGRTGPELELVAAIVKGATNDVAAWWADHPGVPRRALVDVTVETLWPGLRARGAASRAGGGG